MNIKKVSLFLSLLLLCAMLTQLVAAQGILDGAGLAPVKKAITSPVTLPVVTYGSGFEPQEYPIGIVILVWIALFSLVFLILSEAFKTMQTGGAAVAWMSFAISGIAVIGSPYVQYVTDLISVIGLVIFIVLMIFIPFIAWGLGRKMQSIGGNMASEASREASESRQKAHKAQLEERAANQDIKIQKEALSRENDAVKDAKTLLGNPLTGSVGAKLLDLLKIIEKIRQIRDVGQAESLKASFDQQASVVAANITASAKLPPHLAKIEANLEQLRNFDVAFINRMKSHISVLNGLGAARTPAQNTQLNQLRIYLTGISDMEQKRTNLIREAESLTSGLSSNINHGRDLMAAVIRDVHDSNYPDAIANINQLITDIKNETNQITAIRRILGEMDTLIVDQRNILARITPLLP